MEKSTKLQCIQLHHSHLPSIKALFTLLHILIKPFLNLSQDQPIKLIYAYGLTDNITYHEGRRGTKELNLLNHRPMMDVTNFNYLNVTMDEVKVYI